MNRDEGGLQRNVLGGPLGVCSEAPVTGFFRTGCCDTGPQDIGRHTVCIVASEEFLAFSKARGNDLSTPMPEYDFPGVQPGQRWCLCAARWVEAYHAGMAPQVVLNATNEATLDLIPLEALKRYAVDLH
ncbi:MAG: DUF2237 family protein [Rhodocyclaceae bacterium]|jgi:uncharacterized protein (DUF2237 family)|nr:hypothetical protein [Rhodocyclaceae bacterium]MBZ0144879.1 DUF2237 domain-containing protein [Rhodocyclaceae bacterium]MCL4681095.1 DUF2237 family protein [Rhodocyclaceae bacterium]